MYALDTPLFIWATRDSICDRWTLHHNCPFGPRTASYVRSAYAYVEHRTCACAERYMAWSAMNGQGDITLHGVQILAFISDNSRVVRCSETSGLLGYSGGEGFGARRYNRKSTRLNSSHIT